MAISMEVDKFALALDEDQYHDVLHLTDSLSRFARIHAHRHLRPPGPPVDGASRRAWWRYAIQANLEVCVLCLHSHSPPPFS